MKKFSIIFVSVFFLVACRTPQSTTTDSAASSSKGASTTDQGKEEKSMGELMVEFILDLVGDSPKTINDELVRDDI